MNKVAKEEELDGPKIMQGSFFLMLIYIDNVVLFLILCINKLVANMNNKNEVGIKGNATTTLPHI